LLSLGKRVKDVLDVLMGVHFRARRAKRGKE
jgi:hypothetical protein